MPAIPISKQMILLGKERNLKKKKGQFKENRQRLVISFSPWGSIKHAALLIREI